MPTKLGKPTRVASLRPEADRAATVEADGNAVAANVSGTNSTSPAVMPLFQSPGKASFTSNPTSPSRPKQPGRHQRRFTRRLNKRRSLNT
jgi:hypothetical protein